MTNEEAIKSINALNAVCSQKDFYDAEFESALALAIEALEKQTPKKPKVETFSYIYLDDYFGRQYFCPNCNRLLINEDMHGFFSGRKRQYCDVCGQPIDWGVSE